jgi:hypothetical protein
MSKTPLGPRASRDLDQSAGTRNTADNTSHSLQNQAPASTVHSSSVSLAAFDRLALRCEINVKMQAERQSHAGAEDELEDELPA